MASFPYSMAQREFIEGIREEIESKQTMMEFKGIGSGCGCRINGMQRHRTMNQQFSNGNATTTATARGCGAMVSNCMPQHGTPLN
jgi:hypothetical protein